MNGFTEVEVVWDEDELDWDTYNVCIKWCVGEELFNISNLKNRIVSNNEYQQKWLDRVDAYREKRSNTGN